ncbi:MAG: hypothetical protein LUQ65_09425 [Candidatus Helarchaeota archaeon]|nr:hypothetical protein [Candidatus Helarchaeota archaeon]
MSVGLSLAYLGLERFRYVNRTIKLFSDTISAIENFIGSETRDASLTELRNEKKKVKEKGLGSVFFSKVFSSADDYYSFDLVSISIFLAFSVVTLGISVFCKNYILEGWWFLTLYTLIGLGIIVPIFFVLYGNHIIQKKISYLNDKKEYVKATYLPREGTAGGVTYSLSEATYPITINNLLKRTLAKPDEERFVTVLGNLLDNKVATLYENARQRAFSGDMDKASELLAEAVKNDIRCKILAREDPAFIELRKRHEVKWLIN